MEQWRRNLYALWLMQMLVFLGTSLVFPFLPLYVRELGVVGEKEVARWSGVVFSATWLVAALFSPIWGSIGDRHGRKLMILRANFGMAAVIASMGLTRTVHQLLALRLVQGCLGGFGPPALALLTTCAPRDRMGYALGFLQTAQIGGAVVGPLLGGVLADLLGFRRVFFVTGSLVLIGGVIVTFLVKDEALDGREAAKSRVFQNIRFVAEKRPLFAMALSMLLTNFAMMVLQPVFPLFVESLGAPKMGLATTVGAVFALTGLTTMLAAPFWGRRTDSRGAKATLTTSLAGSAVFFSVQALVQTVYQLAPVRLLLGVFTGGVGPASQAIVVANSPDSRRGGVIGITTSAGLMGGFLGPITGGFIAAAIGIRPLFVITGAMLVGICAIVRAVVKDVRPAPQARLKSPQTAGATRSSAPSHSTAEPRNVSPGSGM